MKTNLALLPGFFLIASARAQVQVLPPDFTLFGKTSGEYLAEFHQLTDPLSTNGDYLFPNAVPSATEPVYFLQRPYLGVADPNALQTYFLPDDVYVYFPIASYAFDNIDTIPPLTVPQLWEALDSVVDGITNVHATIDGVALTNLLAYRTRSPVFSIFYPTNDNIISALLGQPFEGLDDPVVAEGYLLMLKPLAAGLHDFRTGDVFSGVISNSFERHFQLQVYHTNHAPVADASATVGRVISPNNHTARVVLDGSRSSDPDNDPLTYSWLDGGAVIGTGILATNTLAIGSHHIGLVVSDGELTATNTITVNVITPCQAVRELKTLAEAAQLPPKRVRPLVEELRDVCSEFDHAFRSGRHGQEERLEHALRELRRFQLEVSEDLQRPDPTLASVLIDGAQEILDALSLPPHHEHGEEAS